MGSFAEWDGPAALGRSPAMSLMHVARLTMNVSRKKVGSLALILEIINFSSICTSAMMIKFSILFVFSTLGMCFFFFYWLIMSKLSENFVVMGMGYV